MLNHAVRANGRRVLVAASPLNLPNSLASEGAVVLAFSSQERLRHNKAIVPLPANRYSDVGPYWFDDLKQAYSWPSYKVVNGKGVTIGVLVDGGFSQSDMDAYFGHEKLTAPKFKTVNVLGGSAFNPKSAGSGEATLDIQQSWGMAPGADVVLYSIPDLSDDSLAAGLVEIVESNQADVVNMSFGGPEQAYSAEYNGGVDYTGILRILDDLFAEGNALGMTFVASSGDYGSTFLPPMACFVKNAPNPCGKLQPAVSFPSSSPHVTAVGGTNLGTVSHPKNPNNLDSTYMYEQAFADPLGIERYGTTATGAYWGSGGGDSVVFGKPDYQQFIRTGSRSRAVPDIALHMGGCPGGLDASCNPEDSADILLLGGQFYGAIGTSASSPDFAGLTALNIAASGTRIGNENYYIYLLAAAQKSGQMQNVFQQRIPGFNGLYTSGNNGYNRVIGVGTPVGKNFLMLFDAPAAGKPQTPSNP
ncbi:MAG: S53 family peptidase [Rhodospirillales bacterium]|nr:S53 family peptidase [Acetobacter sp.]